MTFGRKSDGGVRGVADSRRLNDRMVTSFYPMKNVRGLLDWLGSKHIFSVFDPKNGFFQIELYPASGE